MNFVIYASAMLIDGRNMPPVHSRLYRNPIKKICYVLVDSMYWTSDEDIYFNWIVGACLYLFKEEMSSN